MAKSMTLQRVASGTRRGAFESIGSSPDDEPGGSATPPLTVQRSAAAFALGSSIAMYSATEPLLLEVRWKPKPSIRVPGVRGEFI